MQVHNFYSGPSILPKEVLQEAQAALLNFENTGLSILEISHRSKEFVAVMENARALAKKLLNLSDEYEVIFLQGGASSQFYMIPANFLAKNETAGYIDTGVWANGAMQEAKLYGNVAEIATSKNENYNHIPKDFTVPNNLKYIHITTNNTIYGTQWKAAEIEALRTHNAYLIADTSSDILCQNFDYSIFDVIYAGAQKNIGTAGATLVSIKKNILEKQNKNLPKMIDYSVHITNQSMKNTPAVFSVYISYLTLKWIEKTGLNAIEKNNKEKAALLYDFIDQSVLFQGTVKKEDRSIMNVCFVMNDKEKEDVFAKYAKEKGIVGIEGHRSVGGFRASIYNALPLSSVQYLVDAMQQFEKDNQ